MDSRDPRYKQTTMERSGIEENKNKISVPVAIIYWIYFASIFYFGIAISTYLNWFTMDSEYKFDQIIGYISVTIPLVTLLIVGIIHSSEAK